MGFRAPPPPPPSMQQTRKANVKVTAPRVHKLLFVQNEDGSWNFDEQTRACTRLNEKILSSHAAALVQEFACDATNKETIEKVFTTSVVLELARQGKEYCDVTPRSMRVFSTSLLVPEMLELTSAKKGAFKEWKEMGESFLAKTDEALQKEALEKATAVVAERLKAVTSKKMCMECRQEFSIDKESCPWCPQGSRTDVPQKSNALKCFDLDFSLPPRKDITNVAWSEMEGFHWFSGGLGSVGAFLCQINGELIMAKSGGSAAVREYFGSRIFAELGLAIAKTRPLGTHSAEGSDVVKGLFGAKATNEGEWTKCYFVKKYPIIFCMEYIGGGSEMCMPRPALEHLLEKYPGSLWEQCGRIAATDVLVNNYDRFPVAWNNIGNAANVIVREVPAAGDRAASLEVTAIDQAWLPIQDKAIRQAYIEKVEQLTSMVAAAVADAEGPTSISARAVREGPMRQMSAFASTYLGGPISDEDFFAFLNGFHQQSQRIVEQMTPDVAHRLQVEVHESFPTGVGELVDDSFLAEVHAAMARGLNGKDN